MKPYGSKRSDADELTRQSLEFQVLGRQLKPKQRRKLKSRARQVAKKEIKAALA